MIPVAILSLVGGILLGHYVFTPPLADFFTAFSDYILVALMFSVGIAVGGNKLIFQKLRQYNHRVLVIPLGIIVGSVLGGIVCGLLLREDLNISTAIASNLGWYSLSGVIITDLIGAQAGATAFLAGLMRESLAFMMIPLLAKYCNRYTTIAPAAATSEDTTLPMIIKYTDGEVVILAVLNGVLCSAAVPFLIHFCYNFPRLLP